MAAADWECTVAIVDDDAVFRRALQRLVRSAGFEAQAFATGADFLEAAAQRPPDCVLLDLQMPGLDGFEVQVRMERDGLHVPVVVITGSDTPDGEERAKRGGASAYLRKPVDSEAVIEAIRASVGSTQRGSDGQTRPGSPSGPGRI